METAIYLKEGIKSIPGLVVLGEPQASLIAFTSKELNIFAIAGI
jgi:glutamate/tyrosine decarboxylase-like PLP-dependent enzyme